MTLDLLEPKCVSSSAVVLECWAWGLQRSGKRRHRVLPEAPTSLSSAQTPPTARRYSSCWGVTKDCWESTASAYWPAMWKTTPRCAGVRACLTAGTRCEWSRTRTASQPARAATSSASPAWMSRTRPAPARCALSGAASRLGIPLSGGVLRSAVRTRSSGGSEEELVTGVFLLSFLLAQSTGMLGQ